jgi:hypothetical protein
MVGAVGFINDVGDVAALVDDEGDAVGHAQQAHRRCHQPAAAHRAIGVSHGAVGVGHQWEGEVYFSVKRWWDAASWVETPRMAAPLAWISW